MDAFSRFPHNSFTSSEASGVGESGWHSYSDGLGHTREEQYNWADADIQIDPLRTPGSQCYFRTEPSGGSFHTAMSGHTHQMGGSISQGNLTGQSNSGFQFMQRYDESEAVNSNPPNQFPPSPQVKSNEESTKLFCR